MVLLVETIVKTRDLRIQLLLQGRNRIVERIEMAAVARLVMLVTGEDQLLELAEGVDLAFHCFFSV